MSSESRNDGSDKQGNDGSKHTVNVKGVNVTGSTDDFVDAMKVGANVLSKSEIGPDGSVKIKASTDDVKAGLGVAKNFNYSAANDSKDSNYSSSTPSASPSHPSVVDHTASAPASQVTASMSTEPSAPPAGPKPLIHAHNVSIDITHTFAVSNPSERKPVYYYVMSVTAEGFVMDAAGRMDETQPVVRTWTVPKRFSEFSALHATLGKYAKLPASPDRALLFNSSMDALVAKRRVELKDMMSKILEVPFAMTTSFLIDFLMLNNYVTLDRTGLPRMMQHITHGLPGYGYNCFLYDRLAGILVAASESTEVATKLTNQFFSLKSTLWSGPKAINLEGNTAPAPNTCGMLHCYVLDQRSQSWSCAFKRHFDANVSALAWNLSDRRIYAGFQNGQVAIYHASPNFDEFSLVRGSHPHSQRVDALVYIQEKDLVVSCGRDSTLALQRASSPELEPVCSLKVNEGRLCSAVYDANNDYLFIGSGSSKLLVYDMSKPTPMLVHLLSGHTDAVRTLSHCSQSGYLVSGSFDATCQIWTTSAPTGTASLTGMQRRTTSIGSLVGTKSKIKSVAICTETNMIATGHDNGAILLWDTNNGMINFVLHDHTSSVVDLRWIDNQNTLISAGRDGKIFFYTIQSVDQ